ncbi:MAG: isoaspartyl peptidase/L-asparaginase, partial [bacterium]|nr:isoaspartyl peptidase/L-asparaginase [bacterium]
MANSTRSSKDFAIAVHGGAGVILRQFMTEEREKAYRAGVAASMKAGFDILKDGGSSLDAVQAAVMVMEDDSVFNAGKGAVYTHDGDHEMDACVMDGATQDFGAVAAVRLIANPVKLARLVLDESPHVFLAGTGAERFAEKHGMELVEDSSYFDTKHRWRQLQQALKREKQNAGKPHTQ